MRIVKLCKKRKNNIEFKNQQTNKQRSINKNKNEEEEEEMYVSYVYKHFID